ncbi:amidase family protein [Rhizobium leguminosarum]|uniref:amidase family protein n=2 Tax=Rhizobium leguminosarum TaxID=384 RepID=UPI003F9529AE
MMDDEHIVDTAGAFVPGEIFRLDATAQGSLAGLTFAVKDLIDIAGRRTGGGNPDWRAAATPAAAHAPVVTRLLANGATFLGKTVTDELAFSLEGRNIHYGIPRNPQNPDWLPGGSSSGSAAAVGARLVDFALGTDTGGSVRVPAAFSGIWGMRPSHYAVPLDGVLPFAPSYDTIGWFARDAQTLARVGDVLLPPAQHVDCLTISIVEDTLDMLDPTDAHAFRDAARRLANAAPMQVFEHWPSAQLQWAYSTIQGYEIARSLGSRLDALKPRFAMDIGERFASASAVSYADYETAAAVRRSFAGWLQDRLPPGTVALLPVTSAPHLRIDAPSEEIGRFYASTLALTALAGHAGAPQLQCGSSPLSVMGRCGSDRAILNFALGIDRETSNDGR